jgi:hypothetical protein
VVVQRDLLEPVGKSARVEAILQLTISRVVQRRIHVGT